MIDPVWEEKLSFLVQKDHQMREVLHQKGVLNDAYHPEMEKIHISNAQKLMGLIDKMGFPVLSNAGENGVRLSWLIIHHSISLPDFMRQSLIEMRMAGAQNDYLLELLAYTEDRVAWLEGRLQLYGTQSDWVDGELKRVPVEDVEKLDQRRKSLGLPPIDQVPLLNMMEKPPANPLKKVKEFNTWLVKVGWRI